MQTFVQVRRAVVALMSALVLVVVGGVQAQDAAPVTIDFYFPEATANNAQAIFEEYATQFQALYPNITVNVAYQGSYTDNRTKIQTEVQAGQGPDVAVMLTTDLFSFIEDDSIIPAQELVDALPDGQDYLDSFFPAFLLNSLDADGTVWSLPFQRSTPVLYYNKDLFEAAGLDPEQGPRSREEAIEYARALSDDDTIGYYIPTEGFPIWLMSSFSIAGGQNFATEDPCVVRFDSDATREALAYILSLSADEGVMPTGLLSWGDTPTRFVSGELGMALHTTGSLTRILSEAPFEVGVSFLPSGPAADDGTGYGAPTGGGNLYFFANSSPAEREAAFLWAQFLTSPEIQADWGARTGYVAAVRDAWETEPLASLVAERPQYAVARDQLEFADREFAAYRTIDIQAIINTTLSNIISGAETDIDAALANAQQQIDGLLADVCA